VIRVARQVIRDWVSREHQEYWQSTPGQSHAKSFLSKLSAKRIVKFPKSNRSQARQVGGPLKGRCHLKGHLFKLGVTDSPICGRYHKETETASHILCECEALAKLRFCSLGKHLMEPSDFEEILLCKILYFVRGTGLLAELSSWRCALNQNMVTV
jgi:hypothetical protein